MSNDLARSDGVSASPDVSIADAERLLSAGNLPDALLILADAERRFPERADIPLAASRVLLIASDYRAARDAAERAIALAPDRPEGYVNAGAAAVYLADYARARPLLQRAIALDGSDPFARYRYAQALLQSASPDDAIRATAQATVALAFIARGICDARGIPSELSERFVGLTLTLLATCAPHLSNDRTPPELMAIAHAAAALTDGKRARAATYLDDAPSPSDASDDDAVAAQDAIVLLRARIWQRR
ncbi:MAG: hypothetical protein Q8R16_00335 [bacterium]|nr:hypothetical protein [bacterium]